jgi:hypothetical protein
MRRTQKLIHVLQTKNSTSAFLENLNNASSNTISGPVTPVVKVENALTLSLNIFSSTLGWASDLAHKQYYRLGRRARDKHSSFLQKFANFGKKL